MKTTRSLAVVPSPSPSGSIKYYDEAPEVRELHCKRYNECLTVAYKLEWEGFSCQECDACVLMSREDIRADVEAIASMLNAMPRRRKE